ncbi:MAG: hypothetical protein ABI698_04040 [bacterium]
MKLSTTATLLTRLLVAFVLSASPLAAQQKRVTTARKPAPAPAVAPAEPNPTFDTLLAGLHFPKNLLLLMLANFSNDGSLTPLQANEAAVKAELRTIVSAEAAYQVTTGDGRYGTIDELVKAGLLSKEPIARFGYEIELTVSANKFAATAVPLEYGKSGSLSYFVDESGVVRGGDRAGGPATISDPPIQ